MRLPVLFLALLGLHAAQGTWPWPHKKAATLLPSFTVTPTATESTASSGTTSHRTTKNPHTTSHSTATPGTTSHRPTTATPTTGHGNVTVHPTTSNTTTTTGTSPGFSTSTPHPGPPPPPPSPSPGSREAVGNYTWTNGSQPCVQLQAQIQIRVLYPTQGGGQAWGMSVLNPNRTKAQGGCEGPRPHLLLSFPYGQLSFGFKQDPGQGQSAVYLSYLAVEYNVSFPQAARWTFSAQNASLRDLQAPLGQSFSCRNASIAVSPSSPPRPALAEGPGCSAAPHRDLRAELLLPRGPPVHLGALIIGLILVGLLALVLVAFCIARRRPSAYQAL